MPLGFLEGLIGGFGEQAQQARERNRQQADLEWERRHNYLKDYAEGRYGQPTPEGLQEALTGMAELAQGPKPKKGRGLGGRMRGEMDVALPDLLKRIMEGEAPMHNSDRPTEPVNAQGRPDMRIEERSTPTAEEQVDQAEQEVPQGGAATQRVGLPRPPTSNVAEGELGRAAMMGAQVMGESGPIQSRPITGRATPSPVRRTGPAALFVSPEEQAAMERQQMLRGVDTRAEAYERFPSDWPEGRRRAALDWKMDPAQSQRSPYGAAGKTFYNPQDPDAPPIEARPAMDGPGYVDTQGNPLPPGYVALPSSRGSGAQPTLVPGDTAFALVDRSTGQVTYQPWQPGFTPMAGRNEPITERAPVLVPNPAPEVAGGHYKAITDRLRQIDSGMFSPFGDPETGDAERQAWLDGQAQSVTDAHGQPYEDWQDLLNDMAQPTRIRPSGESLTPPPGMEDAVTGINPAEEEQLDQMLSNIGWSADEQFPNVREVETSSDQDIVRWYLENTAEGRDEVRGLAGGDLTMMAKSALESPQYVEKIRDKLQRLAEAIYGPESGY